MIISRSIHVAANGIISLFFMVQCYSIVCVCVCVCVYTHTSHLLYPFICQWAFRLFVNSAAMNIGVHVSFQIRVFIFSGYMPRSRITGPYVNCIFSFLRNLHSDYTNLHYHQQQIALFLRFKGYLLREALPYVSPLHRTHHQTS